MNYQIVATLGPGSNTTRTWQAMLTAGVTAFRLNTSHLSAKQLRHWLDRLAPFLAALDPRPPLILDLQGSKWRLGEFPTRVLRPGQRVELVRAPAADRPGVLPVPHPDFFQAALSSSEEILLNDAKLKLKREASAGNSMRALVISGGELSARKGITYTASDYRQEALSEKDRAILEWTRRFDFMRYAISYVKDAAEMAKYRAHVGQTAYLIAKLERQPAVDEAPRMAEHANELWLCRGDLGAELGLKALAETAQRFSRTVCDLPVPTLLAGQVLEHMVDHPAPTRSEVCALYDALLAGYRGVVLSDEAAIGHYPIESCQIAALFQARAAP